MRALCEVTATARPGNWAGLVGIFDGGALLGLRAARMPPASLAAITHVPLLALVWQSAAATARRRAALDEAGQAVGLRRDDPGSRLLLALATAGNAEDITKHWASLVRGLVGSLDAAALAALQREVMDRGWLMAAALYGSDASDWPADAFRALRALETPFYASSH